MTVDASTGPVDDFDDEATPATQPATAKDGERPEVPPEVSRALRQANKEAEKLRLRLKEYEDRDKTEQQKLEERATAAERERDETRTSLLRMRVAVAKQLPSELVDRLRGNTEQELAADADALLSLVGPSGRPRGDVDQGVRTAAAPVDMNALIRRGSRR